MSYPESSPLAAPAALRPDIRLLSLHTERGDAHSRLETAFADLEGADWGIILAGEAALARQLRALLGTGVIRLDPRLPLRRDLLAEAGLAAAGLEGDWQSALAVWLLEPSEDDLARAKRAGVPVIADATLAPGAHWLAAGAHWVTYHHGGTLTGFGGGFGDSELALLFGTGERPAPAAPAASDLIAALALRDAATLPLRLARAAQTAAALASELQGRALPLGPTAVLLPPEAAQTTVAPLGGVLPAARAVQGGVIVTPGLGDVRQVRALLRVQPSEQETALRTAVPNSGKQESKQEQESSQRDVQRSMPAIPQPQQPSRDHLQGRERGPREGHERRERRAEHRTDSRSERPEQQRFQQGRARDERDERQPQPVPERFATESATAVPSTPDLERFVFEAPSAVDATEPKIAESKAVQETRPEVQTQFAPATGSEPAVEVAVETATNGASDHSAQQVAVAKEQRTEQQTQMAALVPDLPIASAGSGKPDPTADLTEEQSAIFARLREWRDAEARRQEVSRFIIASNATLAEIARQVPYTAADLGSIKGMGPARLSKYGEAIVQIVRGGRSR